MFDGHGGLQLGSRALISRRKVEAFEAALGGSIAIGALAQAVTHPAGAVRAGAELAQIARSIAAIAGTTGNRLTQKLVECLATGLPLRRTTDVSGNGNGIHGQKNGA